MKNIIILSRNYKDYSSGLYYQDLINAFFSKHNVFLYGPGYDNYCQNDNFEDVVIKSKIYLNDVDLVVVSNSWGDENPVNLVFDVHFKICLNGVNIKKIFFINKEYKKLEQKLLYVQKNNFDIVFTVSKDHKAWSNKTACIFKTMPFGVDLDVFRPLNLKRVYDFSFIGALHRNYGVKSRYEIKKTLFQPQYLCQLSSKSRWTRKTLLKNKYRKYNIYWAEWGAISFFNKPLTLTGKDYVILLNKSKIFLNSLSAEGIFNCRFFELMATKTLIFCPKSVESYGILFDGINAVMFNDDFSDLEEKIQCLIDGKINYEKIVDRAFQDVQKYSYDNIVAKVLDYVDNSNKCENPY